MIRARHALPAPVLLALIAAVAGCGGRSAREQAAAIYCPNPFTVEDAQNLTRFKPGPGRDPRDIEFEATLAGASAACAIGHGRLDVDLRMRIVANAGPSVGSGLSSVPYFVRVIDGSGAVVQGQDFAATFRLSTAHPRGASLEQLSLTLFYNRPSDLGAYRVAVGLKPTPEELQYNRRSAGQ